MDLRFSAAPAGRGGSHAMAEEAALAGQPEGCTG